MAVICDSYSEDNHTNDTAIYSGYQGGREANSFTGDGGVLNSAKFYLYKYGLPTGNIVAKVYSHSGTFGSTGVPDTLLATSDNLDVSTIPTYPNSLVNFTFSGANKITLTDGVYYFVSVDYQGGDVNNNVWVGYSTDYPPYGNRASGNPWDYWTDTAIFYVYKDDVGTKSAVFGEAVKGWKVFDYRLTSQTIQAKASVSIKETKPKTAQAKARIEQEALTKTVTAKSRVKKTISVGDVWTTRYEANELPANSDPVWEKSYLFPVTTESISNGILNLYSDYSADDDRTFMTFMLTDVGFTTNGFTVEARVKVNSFGSEEDDYTFNGSALPCNCYFECGNSDQYLIVTIRDGQVTLYYNLEYDSYAMDTTDSFHIYRLLVDDTIATLYVDGIQKIQVVANLGDDYVTDSITFGNWSDNHRTGIDDAEWDYVYYRTDGAFGVGLQAKVSIFKGTSQTIQSKLDIKKEALEKTVTAKSRIQQLVSQAIQAKTRAKNTLSQTLQAKSLISIGAVTKSIQGRGDIKVEAVSKTIQAKSRIVGTLAKTIQAKANLVYATTQTAQARTRVKIEDLTKTLTAKARLLLTKTKTLQAKSRVKVTALNQTITTKTRLEQLLTKTSQVKADIKQLAQTQTIQAKAYIGVGAVTKTIQSKARVKLTSLQIITACSRVVFERTRTIQTKTRVLSQLEKTIQAKATVASLWTKTVEARARVKKTVGFEDMTTAIFGLAVKGWKIFDNQAGGLTKLWTKARIRWVGLTETVQAKVRLKTTYSCFLQAKAHIVKFAEGAIISAVETIEGIVTTKGKTEGLAFAKSVDIGIVGTKQREGIIQAKDYQRGILRADKLKEIIVSAAETIEGVVTTKGAIEGIAFARVVDTGIVSTRQKEGIIQARDYRRGILRADRLNK